jgi:hypothetical protein
VPRPTPAGHHDRAAVILVAQHPDLLHDKQLTDLLRYRREHLQLGPLARNHRRHPSQRRLLPRQPCQLGLGSPTLSHVHDGAHEFIELA